MSRNQPPCIITVALTGNVPTKKMNPNVPVTPEEIASDAIKCYKAGASIVHVHVRDENEKPTQDLEMYRRVVRILKKEVPDLIIQLTTGGRCGKNPQLRMDVLRLCPEMGSFTTGSNNLAKIIYENSPDFILRLAKTFYDTDVKPEIECFDTGHIDNALFLANRKKLLKYPLHFNFVLGANGAASGTINTLNHMVKKLPKNCTWNCCGIGWSQMKIAAHSIAMGGNVRIGLEDMVYNLDGSLSTNVQQVEKVVRMCKEMGRKIATPAEARKLLGMREDYKDRILKYLDSSVPVHPIDYSVLQGKAPLIKRRGFENVSDEDWNSWKWQMENSIKTVDELKKFVKLSEEDVKELTELLKDNKNFGIPPKLLAEKF